MNQELITKIKAKKELKDISSKFVKEELKKYFQKNPSANKFLKRPRSKNYKKIVKDIRASLRRSTGLFDVGKPLKAGKAKNLLETHSSTRERLSFYEKLYSKIFTLTKKPKTILDLGCGLNPLSIPLMKLKGINYYAYDINGSDIKIVNRFFKEKKIEGHAFVKDILKLRKMPIADVAFLFKMTDVLDRGKGHKKTEEVIERIPAKYVIISFPTLTMSGKPMNFPRRRWIELMCQRLNFPYRILKFSNEIFYVIEK